MKAVSKKVLSLILAISMVLTMVPAFSLAASAASACKWKYVGDSGFSEGAVMPRIVVDSNGTPYAAYIDQNNSSELTVKKYSGSGWQTVGADSPSIGHVCSNYGYSMTIDSGATLYVAYSDESCEGKNTVRKYDPAAAKWETVGQPGFSDKVITSSNIAVDNSGTPYVAYVDFSSFKAVIAKYDAETKTWKDLGTNGLPNSFSGISLALDGDGTPYVEFSDSQNSDKATVMKYNSTSGIWEAVGTKGFSAEAVSSYSIAIDKDGTPYVLYFNNSQIGTVKKYDGTSKDWVTVGTEKIFKSSYYSAHMALDGSGTPYVAYADADNSGKVTVKKFDKGTSNWELAGDAGFSKGAAAYTPITVDGDGIPYVVYTESNSKISVMKLTEVPSYTVTYGSGANGVLRGAASETVAAGDCPKSVPAAVSDGTQIFAGWSSDNGETLLTSAELAAKPVTADVTYTAYYKPGKWQYVGGAGFSSGSAYYTSMALDSDGMPYVAYQDTATKKATVMRYKNSAWETVGAPCFTAGPACEISMKISSNTPYIVYRDKDSSTGGNVTVMKYNGTIWEAVGTDFANTDTASLALDKNGIPYVVYRDCTALQTFVKKWDGSAWKVVGGGACAANTTVTSIAVSKDGTPYVAYRSPSDGFTCVVKLNAAGTGWESVGGAFCSTGNSINSSIVLDGSGTPYVAYRDGASGTPIVRKLNQAGTGWETVGDEFNQSVTYLSIAFDKSETLYESYKNPSGYLNTRKLDGTGKWVTVAGEGDFDSFSGTYSSLAIDGNGMPYVALMDVAHSNRASVIKFAEVACYTVSYRAGEYGTIDGTGKETVADGKSPASVPTVTPTAGYLFAGWSNDGGTTLLTGEQLAQQTISQNETYTAYYVTAHTVTYKAGDHGTIEGAVSEAVADGKNPQSIPDVTPAAGYLFDYWSSDGGVTRLTGDGLAQQTISKDMTYTAYYKAGYIVTYDAGTHGTIDGAASETVAAGGNPAKVPAVSPADGYSFTGWSSDGGKTLLTGAQLAELTVNANVAYTAYYTKNAFKWINVGTPGFSAGTASCPSIAMDGRGTLYAAYVDGGCLGRATVKKYNGTVWETVGEEGFSTQKYLDNISIAISKDNTPYVAYNASGTIKVMKYDGSVWAAVGTINECTDEDNRVSLVIGKDGMPYVAYQRLDTRVASLLKFNGTQWQVSTVSDGAKIWGVAVALDTNGMPYVGYHDTDNNRFVLKKYSGSDWQTLGTADDTYNNVSLVVAPDGTPYAALSGGGYTFTALGVARVNAVVLKYNSSDNKLETVGANGFSEGRAYYASLAVDGSGTPYITYMDGANRQKATTRKYNGTDWENVGNTGFSAGSVSNPDIVLDANGKPYVIYQDSANGRKATVMTVLANTCSVTYEAGANGKLSGSASETVNVGGKLKSIPTVTPNTGYEFAGWSSDGGKTLLTSAQLAALAIEDDVTYTACYKDKSGSKAVTGVTLSPSSMTLTAGGSSETLTATIAPVDASNKNVTWSSNNSGVASVSNGVVTPVSAGTAVITVTTADGGKTASCTVTVTAAGGGSDKHSGNSDTKAPSYNDVTKVDPVGNTVTVTPKADRVSVNGNTADIETVVTNITTDDTGTSTNGSVADAAKKTAVTINVPTDAVKQQLAAKKDVELTVTVPSEVVKDTNPNLAVNINANKEILEAAKENLTDVTIQVKNADTQQLAYSWTFKGEDLAKSTVPVTDINISMSVRSTTEVPAVNSATSNSKGLVLMFDHSGLLPSVASVKISVLDRGYKPGQTLYFYYYNPATKQIEPLDKNAYVVDANGNVTVQISHCSDYVLLPNAARSLTLDTRTYTVAMKDSYEIGVKLTGGKGSAVKVYSSARGIASVTKLKNGNYRVTGLKAGLTYIMFDVYDEKGKLISKAHASVRMTVKKGVNSSGDSHRQTATF